MAEKSRATQHFDSIEQVLALFDQETVADELRNYFRLEGIDYLWTAEGALIPSITAPFASPYLYRGQVARYRPCVPAVFRGLEQTHHPRKLPPADRARSFVDRVRLEEFVLALEAHPASAYAREIGLRLRPYALAQHYELATDRLDLTQDHRVAAFFATHTKENGAWVPIKDGVGVMYRLPRRPFENHFQERLECIGKQALPRPGEQKGYALVLPLGEDFEALPVEIHTFSQVEIAGRRISDQFDGGSALFPPDVMAEVAATIKSEPSISRQVVDRVLGGEVAPLDGRSGVFVRTMAFLDQHSTVRISEREPISLSSSQLDRALAGVETMRSTFLKGVGALAVSRI
ncbi:MAG TPA: FRG domain-containing protein [Luteimonas sp.]|nr:FRG domain-containing protein [Luteimonas sp.]